MSHSARLDATFAALADPTRRAILARLARGETSVGELAAPFDMSLPAISKHLKVLERAGLISRGRDAQWRPCRLEPAPLDAAIAIGSSGIARSDEDSLDRLGDYLKTLQDDRRRRTMAAGNERAPRCSRASTTRRAASCSRRWTTAEHLEKWFGPDGFTAHCTMDFRVGGKVASR